MSKEELLSELELRDRILAEEVAAKYAALKRIAELQEELNKLKGESNDD